MYDFFISHASEDKEAVALPLALRLRELRFEVWLDIFELTVGDSLREKVDDGLILSRHGVVILSANFFAKPWPIQELNALYSKSIASPRAILPVWHGIDRRFLLSRAPLLADRLAANTADGLDRVAEALARAATVTREKHSRSSTRLAEPNDRDERGSASPAIVTWTDLILLVGKKVLGSPIVARDASDGRLKRAAAYLDDIAEALQRAADAFTSKHRPWDTYRQVHVHFDKLFDTLGDTLPSGEVRQLHEELRRALYQDRLLLGPTEDRVNLDAITLSTSPYGSLPDDHELRVLSDAAVSTRLHSEIDKIREAAGVFTAYAVELRARA